MGPGDARRRHAIASRLCRLSLRESCWRGGARRLDAIPSRVYTLHAVRLQCFVRFAPRAFAERKPTVIVAITLRVMNAALLTRSVRATGAALGHVSLHP